MGLHTTTTGPTGLYTLYDPHLSQISPHSARPSRASLRVAATALHDAFRRASTYLPLHRRGSSRPSSPPPHARTAAARGHTHPIAAVASTTSTARLGHRIVPYRRGPCSCMPVAILLLHRNRIARSHRAVLRPPA
jgi:hypothetical protein